MRARIFLSLAATAAAAACDGGAAAPDAKTVIVDAAPDDAAPPGDAPWLPDGDPQRVPCTHNLGTALTTTHGRLDGYLVAIVPVGASGCNGDSSHVHLQVRAGGATYDVAVNVSDPASVDYLAQDLPLPDGPWREGWHPAQAALLDYPSLGVHAAAFAPTATADLAAALDAELAHANHVSIFMTGYGPDGGHLVHRNGGGNDGAIFVQPLGRARALMFHFSTQTF